jgi:membrane protein DedA with SNARE-associated domain
MVEVGKLAPGTRVYTNVVAGASGLAFRDFVFGLLPSTALATVLSGIVGWIAGVAFSLVLHGGNMRAAGLWPARLAVLPRLHLVRAGRFRHGREAGRLRSRSGRSHLHPAALSRATPAWSASQPLRAADPQSL